LDFFSRASVEPRYPLGRFCFRKQLFPWAIRSPPILSCRELFNEGDRVARVHRLDQLRASLAPMGPGW
jgi:hypothetical protein